ncbi:MAG: cation:proton antiporter [Planctomycetales bacterium]
MRVTIMDPAVASRQETCLRGSEKRRLASVSGSGSFGPVDIPQGIRMESLSHHDVAVMLVSLGALLAVARVLGEIAQWLHQPAVVGEILAGILLGPTVFGALAPEWQGALFPSSGPVALVLGGLTTLAITLFLLVAGMEVDLSTAWKQGTTALKVAVVGMAVPFAIGFAAAWTVPRAMGVHAGADPLIFSLFFATALSISALPVIAKTLMDLNLYRSDLGMVIVSAAVINDLVGWLVFAIILGMLGPGAGQEARIAVTIVLTLAFAATMLTAGRWLLHRALPYVQAHTRWPGGVLSFALALALFGAACTEWIGIHAIFGAFLVGVAIGDSSHLREQTRMTIDSFVSFFFAPLFFASIGLRVDFATSFDATLVLTILVVACAGKLLGCGLGAAWGGMSRRDAWAVGFGMNARGAMEIILGLLALEAGMIRERLFVALVLMALVTSMLGGPMLQFVLGRRKPRRIGDFLAARRFIPRLESATGREAIRELAAAACAGGSCGAAAAGEAVWEREQTMHTGIGDGIAVPRARLAGLGAPLVAVGMSEAGIDFDAPDGEPAHLVFLVLTPVEDDGAQLEILSEIARLFRDRARLERARRARTLTEFLAALKSEPPRAGGPEPETA